ncbi:MAG: hypothetical protein KJO73_07680 [Croceitalea sp.]|nr:hypothetical protein [Croceitalea sp.]
MRELLSQIVALTNKIKAKYPELYQFLDESPLTLPTKTHPTIDLESMKEYRDSLIEMLVNYSKTHRTNTI